VNVDDLGFTLVDLEKKSYKKDPFIMAYQAKQVFFMLKILLTKGGQLSFKGEMNMTLKTMRT